MYSKQNNGIADTRHDRGVTLIELVVVLGMMAIIAAMAVTSLSSEGSKLRAAAYNLRTELMSAKAEAIKQNKTVTVTFNDAADSYQATLGGSVIFNNSLQQGINLNASAANFQFTSISTAFPNNGKVTLTHFEKQYEIQINSAAKVVVTHVK